MIINLDFDTPLDYVEPPKMVEVPIDKNTITKPGIVSPKNRKIAFPATAVCRNKKIDEFKTSKSGIFVPFSGTGHKLGSN